MWESLGTMRKYLWRYRWGMALGGLCLICKDLAQAVQPLMIRGAVDNFRNGNAFVRYALFLVGLAILKGFFQYWMRVIIIGISRDTEFDLRNDLFAHLIKLSPDFYARTRTGDIMARATNDLNAVRMMLGPGVMYWFETSLTFALAIAIMMRVDWRMALFAILPAPAVSFAVIFFGRIIHHRFETIQAMFADISSRVQENLAGVRMIRAFTQEKAEMRRFEELNKAYIAQNIKLVRMQGIFQPLLEALIGMTFLVVLWFGGRQVLAGKISVGSLIMFNTYMGMLVWPMIALGWVVNLTQRGSASLKRINEILREQPLIAAPPDPVPLGDVRGDVRGEIEFRRVKVDYDGTPALRQIDLRIPAGTTLAVVGHTGSGKSTLVSLVPRLLDPTAGEVLLDGHDLRRLDPAELRRQIGFVPQETFLFSATLAENIAFGVENATPEQIRRAAEMAGLAGDIEGFPKGYETMVGERGITLSGGQKQRTAIARALIRDPKILILDDALSSVDTLTEERILTHLAGVMRGRTVILISHRVSTVQQADCIVVLERGKIVERGTHAELVEAGGYYAALSQKQMLEEELEAI
jgi:ATP-binding cassette subfamily B multidrug efflux pump